MSSRRRLISVAVVALLAGIDDVVAAESGSRQSSWQPSPEDLLQSSVALASLPASDDAVAADRGSCRQLQCGATAIRLGVGELAAPLSHSSPAAAWNTPSRCRPRRSQSVLTAVAVRGVAVVALLEGIEDSVAAEARAPTGQIVQAVAIAVQAIVADFGRAWMDRAVGVVAVVATASCVGEGVTVVVEAEHRHGAIGLAAITRQGVAVVAGLEHINDPVAADLVPQAVEPTAITGIGVSVVADFAGIEDPVAAETQASEGRVVQAVAVAVDAVVAGFGRAWVDRGVEVVAVASTTGAVPEAVLVRIEAGPGAVGLTPISGEGVAVVAILSWIEDPVAAVARAPQGRIVQTVTIAIDAVVAGFGCTGIHPGIGVVAVVATAGGIRQIRPCPRRRKPRRPGRRHRPGRRSRPVRCSRCLRRRRRPHHRCCR